MISPGQVLFRNRCPRCGEGKLFSGLLAVSAVCSHCGLTLAKHEQGDGPAFFGILLVGALAAIGAAIMEIKYEPPFWLHALIWGPFVIAGALASLRFGKALLIYTQYQVKPDDFD